MTSSQLIELIKQADPDGNTPIGVGNSDILDVCREPAYWDGCLQQLYRDKNSSGYNIVGGEFVSEGCKIVISPHSISDAIFENPDLPVKYDNYTKEKYFESVEKTREKVRKVKEKTDGKEGR